MRKKTSFLDFYRRRIKTGRLQGNGLCGSLNFDMTRDDIFYLFYSDPSFWGYCGYNGHRYFDGATMQPITIRRKFTPLRQNIVLFCAAINGEL